MFPMLIGDLQQQHDISESQVKPYVHENFFGQFDLKQHSKSKPVLNNSINFYVFVLHSMSALESV